jgi:hypothetical protein
MEGKKKIIKNNKNGYKKEYSVFVVDCLTTAAVTCQSA